MSFREQNSVPNHSLHGAQAFERGNGFRLCLVGLGVAQVFLGILDVRGELLDVDLLDRDRLFGEQRQASSRNVGKAAANELPSAPAPDVPQPPLAAMNAPSPSPPSAPMSLP